MKGLNKQTCTQNHSSLEFKCRSQQENFHPQTTACWNSNEGPNKQTCTPKPQLIGIKMKDSIAGKFTTYDFFCHLLSTWITKGELISSEIQGGKFTTYKQHYFSRSLWQWVNLPPRHITLQLNHMTDIYLATCCCFIDNKRAIKIIGGKFTSYSVHSEYITSNLVDFTRKARW